jgi:hypothetical protein
MQILMLTGSGIKVNRLKNDQITVPKNAKNPKFISITQTPYEDRYITIFLKKVRLSIKVSKSEFRPPFNTPTSLKQLLPATTHNDQHF